MGRGRGRGGGGGGSNVIVIDNLNVIVIDNKKCIPKSRQEVLVGTVTFSNRPFESHHGVELWCRKEEGYLTLTVKMVEGLVIHMI